MKTRSYIIAIFFFMFLTIIGGCSKENSIQSTAQDSQATDDAAVSIAGAIATNNGGLLDQVQDLLNTPTNTGIQAKTLADSYQTQTFIASYDSVTGWWTDSLSRNKSGVTWATQYSRVYKHQFLNKNGTFQKRYITNSDTAYTIHHEIVSGSESFSNAWLSHALKSLTAKWTGAGTNTDVVTINTTEPYTRTFTDTVTRATSKRTLDGSLTVNFVNVTGPRGSGLNWHKKLSGTVNGHYHAFVTFLKGTSYNEKTIDRDFTIEFGDSLKIKVGGKTYYADAETGSIGN